MTFIAYTIFCLAALPFIYYLLAIYTSLRFFSSPRHVAQMSGRFAPPVTILKPVRGLDRDAFENFASFCRQDYPEYEIIFCTSDETDPSVPVIQELIREFPHLRIRLLFSAGHKAINDKVAKLALMTDEAQYDCLVISDSDVRVTPDYLRKVVGPFSDPKVGGTTCFYVSIHDRTLAERFQTIGMISDFYAGILVAWQLEGIRFALGPTMVTTKDRVRGFGGFRALQNRPGDDLLFGRLIAEQGFEVRLLPYAVETVADYNGLRELFAKRIRWMTVMRQMRPWGHFGLLFTWGLPWSIVAIAIRPTAQIAAGFLGFYLLCRLLIGSLIGIYGLKQKDLWKKLLLVPLWDLMAFWIWLVSFTRKSIMWRKVEHSIDSGEFVGQQISVEQAAAKSER